MYTCKLNGIVNFHIYNSKSYYNTYFHFQHTFQSLTILLYTSYTSTIHPLHLSSTPPTPLIHSPYTSNLHPEPYPTPKPYTTPLHLSSTPQPISYTYTSPLHLSSTLLHLSSTPLLYTTSPTSNIPVLYTHYTYPKHRLNLFFWIIFHPSRAEDLVSLQHRVVCESSQVVAFRLIEHT